MRPTGEVVRARHPQVAEEDHPLNTRSSVRLFFGRAEEN